MSNEKNSNEFEATAAAALPEIKSVQARSAKDFASVVQNYRDAGYVYFAGQEAHAASRDAFLSNGVARVHVWWRK